MYEDASREREYLCFILKTAERGGEDQTVVIALELRTVVMAWAMTVLLSETFVADELFPVHTV